MSSWILMIETLLRIFERLDDGERGDVQALVKLPFRFSHDAASVQGNAFCECRALRPL